MTLIFYWYIAYNVKRVKLFRKVDFLPQKNYVKCFQRNIFIINIPILVPHILN